MSPSPRPSGLVNETGTRLTEEQVDKLDHGISKRPSRFDRKYCFGNPPIEDRIRYCESWRCVPSPQLIFPVLDQVPDPSSSQKLSGKPAAAMPSTVPHHIASMTDGFSFAYLKETYIASLLTLVQYSAIEDMPVETEEDRKWGRFGNLLQQQVATLREDISK